MDLAETLKQKNSIVIDVRSYNEFMGGHVVDSLNIPLGEIPDQIEKIKAMQAPIVLCCASGNRSGQAQHYLSTHGITSYNGGSWLEVNYLKSK